MRSQSDIRRSSRGSRRLNAAQGQESGFADKRTSAPQTGPSDRPRSIEAFHRGQVTAGRPGVQAGADQARRSRPPFGRGLRCCSAAHGYSGLIQEAPGNELIGWDRGKYCRWIAGRPIRRTRIPDAQNADPCSIMNHPLEQRRARPAVRYEFCEGDDGRGPRAAMSRRTLWQR
jgi:hypothetical protein